MCSRRRTRAPQTRMRRVNNVNNTPAPPTPIITLRLISAVPAIDDRRWYARNPTRWTRRTCHVPDTYRIAGLTITGRSLRWQQCAEDYSHTRESAPCSRRIARRDRWAVTEGCEQWTRLSADSLLLERGLTLSSSRTTTRTNARLEISRAIWQAALAMATSETSNHLSLAQIRSSVTRSLTRSTRFNVARSIKNLSPDL